MRSVPAPPWAARGPRTEGADRRRQPGVPHGGPADRRRGRCGLLASTSSGVGTVSGELHYVTWPSRPDITVTVIGVNDMRFRVATAVIEANVARVRKRFRASRAMSLSSACHQSVRLNVLAPPYDTSAPSPRHRHRAVGEHGHRPPRLRDSRRRTRQTEKGMAAFRVAIVAGIRQCLTGGSDWGWSTHRADFQRLVRDQRPGDPRERSRRAGPQVADREHRSDRHRAIEILNGPPHRGAARCGCWSEPLPRLARMPHRRGRERTTAFLHDQLPMQEGRGRPDSRV